LKNFPEISGGNNKMKKSNIMFITIVLTSACSMIQPTPTQPAFPTVAVQQVALNPPTSSSTEVLTSTPAPTNPPTGTPTGSPLYTPVSTYPNTLGIHVVRSGEWLYCIGRAYGVLPSAIAKVNSLQPPYIVLPNQGLTIPNVPWTNIPAGPVCKAQFTGSVSSPMDTLTPTPATLVVAYTTELPPPPPEPTDTPCPTYPSCVGTTNAEDTFLVEHAEMISYPTTNACRKFSDYPKNHIEKFQLPLPDNSSVAVEWIESGLSTPGENLSLFFHHGSQLLGSKTIPTTGKRVCTIFLVPKPPTGKYETGAYETTIVVHNELTILYWSIGQ
jgi:LysM repeat protein